MFSGRFDRHEVWRSTERTFTGGRFDSPDVEIMRDDLCRVLYEAVGNQVEYLFGDAIASLTQDESGVNVTFVTAAPRRFDLVIGADGLHSGVRRLAFGPEEQFIRYLGIGYIATFGMPNIFGLDHWQVYYQHEGAGAVLMGLRKDTDVRAYVGFTTPKPIDYDYRDIDAQKRLVADRVVGAGWVLPQIVEHLFQASDFHFDGMSQIRMDSWSHRRIVLVGDAAYCVSPATGQGTTIAMVGAYVLAGELATHKGDLVAGVAAYEDELRDYVTRNLDIALDVALGMSSEQQTISGKPMEAEETTHPDDSSDFGPGPDFRQMLQPLTLKNYPLR